MSQHKRVLLVDSSGNPIITTPFQFDDTDKLAVSLYTKESAAGDTPVESDAGNMKVSIYEGNARMDIGGVPLASDAISGSQFVGLNAEAYTRLFDGTQWNRKRNNEEITLLASAGRTAQTQSSDQVNYNHRGGILFVNVTVDPSTASITPRIMSINPVSANTKVIWTAAAALNSTGEYVYVLYPGADDAMSYTETKRSILPRQW